MARVLVLGAYGLIGAEVARHLTALGHEVVALGRDMAVARRVLPGYRWVIRDLRSLIRPEDWRPIVADIDFVVNCAGALQQNPRDDLEVVHLRAVGALVLACEKARVGLVQISAVGAQPGERVAFFRTKAEGDALIRESSVDWWILRPGLVIAPSSYGGTTLIRVLAGVPYVQPIALPRARVQTVAVMDVAQAVGRAIGGEVAPGTEADLVEDNAHLLVDIVGATRRWIGFPPARYTIAVPHWALRLTARGFDLFGRLGWRSPLRSTAVDSLARGVLGDARQTRRVLGRPAMALDETFRAIPARMEDRLFARTHLLGPFLIFAIAIAWLLQGLSALVGFEALVTELAATGLSDIAARVLVGTLASLSVALGASLMLRRWASRALVVMVFVQLFHAVAISMLLPGLWLDPYGSGSNILPQIMATLSARVLLDTR